LASKTTDIGISAKRERGVPDAKSDSKLLESYGRPNELEGLGQSGPCHSIDIKKGGKVRNKLHTLLKTASIQRVAKILWRKMQMDSSERNRREHNPAPIWPASQLGFSYAEKGVWGQELIIRRF